MNFCVIDCVARNRAAEIVTKYTHKGNKLAVTGQMRNRSYEKNGQKITRCECIVDTLELIEPKTDAPKVDETPRFEPIPEDGDLPF